MVAAMRSPTPGRELAAPGCDGRAVAMLDASVPLSREAPPGRAGSRIRTREIVAATIWGDGGYTASSPRP